MPRINHVKLEFIRPGPPHNQLLSPLTPYMAMCGEGSPITFYMDFEHHQLLKRLERLRYVSVGTRGGVAVPDSIREATVSELGMDVARIFSKVETLLAEECRVLGKAGTGLEQDDMQMIHLRIVLSGSELSLIPFEMAIAPQAYPGEGVEWVLQESLPIVPTREIRRTRPAPVRWDRPLEPKILFISASPQGLEVPLALHVQALRTALDPWIRWPAAVEGESDRTQWEQKRLAYTKERLRLLPNATIEDIYDLCAREQFTHVHILAHGAQREVGGEKRFGLALCDAGDRNRMTVVGGKQLAKALLAEGRDGIHRSQPLMVTLATCDSGNPGSVLVPGGSIAHDLQTAGIPWVVASQFPLTKVGSVRMTETLYQRILRGDDPRQVLYEVRRQLYMTSERDHDWASIVAYATVPVDFEDQVAAYFERQMRQAITVALNRADNALDKEEMQGALQAGIDRLELWQTRLPDGNGLKARERRAEFYGMYGSTRKRIGLLQYKKNQPAKGREELEKALNWYTLAMTQWALKESRHHWVATQTLSLAAVLGKAKDPETWLMARKFAERDLARSEGSAKAWAHGTMAELAILAKYHFPAKAGRSVEKTVAEHCRAILELMGEDSFEVFSTRRQFQRYVDYWPNPDWDAAARAAVAALTPVAATGQVGLPPYA